MPANVRLSISLSHADSPTDSHRPCWHSSAYHSILPTHTCLPSTPQVTPTVGSTITAHIPPDFLLLTCEPYLQFMPMVSYCYWLYSVLYYLPSGLELGRSFLAWCRAFYLLVSCCYAFYYQWDRRSILRRGMAQEGSFCMPLMPFTVYCYYIYPTVYPPQFVTYYYSPRCHDSWRSCTTRDDVKTGGHYM